MAHNVKIKLIEHLTHDVLRIVTEKPFGLIFKPGQAVDLSINKPGWEKELRVFTFTSLPHDSHVEFMIKTYPANNGVTNKLLSLVAGDELIIGEVFGTITYKGEGIFIAGGAGITPFVSIFKNLEKEKKIGNNKLIFANKTRHDVFFDKELTKMLGSNFVNILSAEKVPGYEYGIVTANLIQKLIDNSTQYFYLCGPLPMMLVLENRLSIMGIKESQIVKEAF